MEFRNSLKFRHGTVTRGDHIIVNGHMLARFMGSFKEENHEWKHIVYVYGSSSGRLEPFLCTANTREITCHQQQEPAIEGQMAIC